MEYRLRPWLLLALSFLGLFFPSACAQQEESRDRTRDPARVRIDAYHAHTWLGTLPRPGLTDYHLLHGPARAAHALRAMGWEVEPQLAPWTASALEAVDLVVINLVSVDRPPFTVSEIQSLVDYVRTGGGLLVITDHTNCYFHNHALGPLFHELGMMLTSVAVCEYEPHALGSGNGWINIHSFADHPMLSGIRNVAFQLGGSVDPKAAVAWSSDNAWADEGRMPAFGEGSSMGFFGDFQRQPNEERGPIGVVAASSIGEGRVAIIADQNAIGGVFLNYADNRRLWLQAAVWTAHGAALSIDAAPRLAERGMAVEPERSLVWCVEPLSEHQYWWGDTGPGGLYHAFALLGKYADARATDRTLVDADWMFLPSSAMLQTERWREQLRLHLSHADRRAVVFCEDPEGPWLSSWVIDAQAVSQSVPQAVQHAAQQAGWDAMYRLPSGGLLFTVAGRGAWENAAIPGPEKIRSDSEQSWDSGRLEWLWEHGLRRVHSIDDDVLWPVD